MYIQDCYVPLINLPLYPYRNDTVYFWQYSFLRNLLCLVLLTSPAFFWLELASFSIISFWSFCVSVFKVGFLSTSGIFCCCYNTLFTNLMTQNNINLLSCSSLLHKSGVGLTRLKSQCQQSCLLPSSASRDHLHALSGSCPLSAKPAALNSWAFSHRLRLQLILMSSASLSLSKKDPWNYLGPTHIIRDNPLFLVQLTMCNPSTFILCCVT